MQKLSGSLGQPPYDLSAVCFSNLGLADVVYLLVLVPEFLKGSQSE